MFPTSCVTGLPSWRSRNRTSRVQASTRLLQEWHKHTAEKKNMWRQACTETIQAVLENNFRLHWLVMQRVKTECACILKVCLFPYKGSTIQAHLCSSSVAPTWQSDFLTYNPAFPSSWYGTRSPPANPSKSLRWLRGTCSCSTTEWGGQTDRSTLLRLNSYIFFQHFNSLIHQSDFCLSSTLRTCTGLPALEGQQMGELV